MGFFQNYGLVTSLSRCHYYFYKNYIILSITPRWDFSDLSLRGDARDDPWSLFLGNSHKIKTSATYVTLACGFMVIVFEVFELLPQIFFNWQNKTAQGWDYWYFFWKTFLVLICCESVLPSCVSRHNDLLHAQCEFSSNNEFRFHLSLFPPSRRSPPILRFLWLSIGLSVGIITSTTCLGLPGATVIAPFMCLAFSLTVLWQKRLYDDDSTLLCSNGGASSVEPINSSVGLGADAE